MTFIEEIKQSDVDIYKGVSDQEISDAERKLGMSFPKTYREILSAFGSVDIDSDEIFGLGVEGYSNVVETTLKERDLAKGALHSFIVIQNIGIDGILIVVDKNDNVYEYKNGDFKNLLSSTAEYILSLI